MLRFVVSLALLAGLQAAPLRVCSDPSNLPFSNREQEGFENKIASLIARELGATLQYTWWQQRRNYVRNTLNSGRCDLLIGFPAHSDEVFSTDPYYTSTFVFVTRKGSHPVSSLDDPALRRLRIGLHVTDDTYTPPGAALARRGIVRFTGYSLFGEPNEPTPPAKILEGVAKGDIDVAIVWGPLGGYFARRSRVPLTLTPVDRARDGVVPLRFSITAAVRKGNTALRDQVNSVLRRNAGEIRRILEGYGVPLVNPSTAVAGGIAP